MKFLLSVAFVFQKQQIKVVQSQGVQPGYLEEGHVPRSEPAFLAGQREFASGPPAVRTGAVVMEEEEEEEEIEEQPLQSRPLVSEEDTDMPDIDREQPPEDLIENGGPGEAVEMDMAPSSHRLADRLGVLAEELQLRKASFFGDEDEEPMPKWKG